MRGIFDVEEKACEKKVQVAPNHSPEFCLKLTYLLIAYNDPVDSWLGPVLATWTQFE